MKEISLTQGQYALVDNEDYERINQMGKWCVNYNIGTKSFYAVKAVRDFTKKSKQSLIRMHRVIMDCPSDKEIDHINHDTLDNTKVNLRICNHSQNVMNKKPKHNSSSKFKGVHLEKQYYKDKTYTYWFSQIRINGKTIHLGRFKNEIDGAKAYDKKAIELFGRFALTNRMLGLI